MTKGDTITVLKGPESGTRASGEIVEVRKDNLLVKFPGLNYNYVIPKKDVI